MSQTCSQLPDLSKDTKLIIMFIYKGFPSKLYLPVLKRYSQRNLLQSINTGFASWLAIE